ncbi:cytochrome P450 [Streptomyces rhizosphaericus]|uniref:cytochrome P450 n=1 Tax=Streptomyces rhizosphaericus TaxID=114699 RepID=UPI000A3D2BE5|nr:cytochrome P450 [Streptomyces rhizosphaericus]
MASTPQQQTSPADPAGIAPPAGVAERGALTGPDLTDLDLTDPQTFTGTDLTALWRRFRAEAPVHWHPEAPGRPGFWVLSRYADIMAVYRDNTSFTSEYGNVLATLLKGGDSAAGHMLAVTDGPRHQAIRTLLLKSFSPRALGPVVAGVRRRTDALLAEVTARGTCDFAKDVAEHIPIATICDLLGVPLGDRQFLLDLNKQALSSDDADHSELDALGARNDILMYFSELARHRREKPADDVVSVLATGQIDGEPLNEAEVVLNCYSLILGGDETSRLSMIGAVAAFLDHPDQWRRLKDGTVSLETAVEEVLRWVTPTMHFGRRALRDLVIGGELIEEGDVVTLWNTSANADDSVFNDPARFDLARSPNKHVAFGYGPHFCLGAFLGRAEVAAALDALRRTVDHVAAAGDPAPLYSNFLHGLASLPVRLVPRMGDAA